MSIYDKRDIVKLDMAGGYYARHISAMTSEQLHDKSDIAAELAFRDYELDLLKQRLRDLGESVE